MASVFRLGILELGHVLIRQKQNILNLVSYVSLNMATFAYLSKLNLKLFEN